ncbi:MAG TPA: RNA polymerase-binding protein DksA, partial [Rhodanobacteraceae bacterium]
MAKPKHGTAARGSKQTKPAAKPARAKAVQKAATRPAHKAAGVHPRKPVAKATRSTGPAKPARHAASGKPAARPASAPKKAPPVHASAAAHQHTAPAAARAAAASPRTHVRPTGGIVAKLSVAAADEQTITREDGRYALPATVNIDLPKGYHPGVAEEYMNPRQLAYFRQKLKDWRDRLVEESRQTMENLREEVRDVGDDAERATRETENSLELRTRDRYRKLISKIEQALRKIEEGRYGYCEETDEEIGLERLDARPIA